MHVKGNGPMPPWTPERPMVLGFALTQHCNLRCPHCIRDDVTTVRSLDTDFVASVVDQARDLYGHVLVSFTGGEPTIHPGWTELIERLRQRQVPYRFVSNGWHMRRLMPSLDRYPPNAVRLSLSGGNREVHDAERGRGSFHRVLLAVGLLTSRRIPTWLSIVIDARDLHQIEETAELAEALGCTGVSFILPQPVVGSAERGSDLHPDAWAPVRDRVLAMAADPNRRTTIIMDYGAPFEGEERLCETFALRRIYVDAHGRVCACCQLSDYGFNETEVIADLNRVPLAEAHRRYVAYLDELRRVTAPDPAEPFDRFPCMRCARACGKLDWLRQYPDSPWHGAAGPLDGPRVSAVRAGERHLVQLAAGR